MSSSDHLVHESLRRLMFELKSRTFDQFNKLNMNVTPMHLVVLRAVSKTGQMTLLNLASEMRRDKSQVARLVNDLVANGMLEKMPNPADKRSQFLTLAESGQTLLDKITPIEERIAAKITRDMPEDEVEHCLALLNKMINNLRAED